MQFRGPLSPAAPKRTRGHCNIDGEADPPRKPPTSPRGRGSHCLVSNLPERSLPRSTCAVGRIAHRSAACAQPPTTRSGSQLAGHVSPTLIERPHRMMLPPAPTFSRK